MTTEREYPWHQRKASLKHHRWFKNIVDLHSITQAWLEEVPVDQSEDPHLTADILLLESMTDARLEHLLDDTSPQDLLGRLEASIRAVQTWTHSKIFSESKGAETDRLSSVLEQATWKQGRAVAEKRWPRLPEASRSDLRILFLTLIDSPMALGLGEDAFLLTHGLSHGLRFEFHACPHAMLFSDIMYSESGICALHSAWVRGYLYALNPKIQMEYFPVPRPNQRCAQHWRLAP
jgi:hypothetical protein